MGVYGLGIGLQFGLEVENFMFIIQTKEGMEHFKKGGNFVVGGNIGAAVVNCGREAYGAASLGQLGACTGRLPLDDQIEQEDADKLMHMQSLTSIVNNPKKESFFNKMKNGIKWRD